MTPKQYPTSIRLPRQLKAKLQAAADAEHRLLSVQILHILAQWVKWWEGQKK